MKFTSTQRALISSLLLIPWAQLCLLAHQLAAELPAGRAARQAAAAAATTVVPRVAGSQEATGGPSLLRAPAGEQRGRLVGSSSSQYKLPSWFSYELYKRFYGKRRPAQSENEIRKRIYLRTALQVFERRAQYRAGRLDSLASVNELSDLVSRVECRHFKPSTQRQTSNSRAHSSRMQLADWRPDSSRAARLQEARGQASAKWDQRAT